MDRHIYGVKKLSKIQIGFKRDCEKLLKTYVGYETHSYGKFCEIWKEMNFSLIYTGARNLEEISRETEMFFFEAKKYFLYAANIYFKTAALYLLYGLYYKQPLKDAIKIRLLQNEFAVFDDYVAALKTLGAFDAMYVYGKLKHDGAFNYVYTQTPLAPDLKTIAKHFATMVNDTYKENVEDKVMDGLKGLIENENVSAVSRDYEKALKEYFGEDRSIMSFDLDIQKELNRIFFKEKSPPEESETADNVGEKRIKLKQKAAGLKRDNYKVSKMNQ